MKEKSANDIVDGSKHAFRFTILLGCIRTRKTHENTILVKKLLELKVTVFPPVITLESFNIHLKLIINKRMKVHKFIKHKKNHQEI